MAEKRSLPTSRNDGMTNIISATISLLESKGPQDITLRDIARESGHGHRLIVEWFGGKGGLYADVFNEIFKNLAESGELYFADVPTRPEIKKMFQLLVYMQMHHPEYVQAERTGFVLGLVRERFEKNIDVTREEADRIARQVSALMMGLSVVNDLFELTDDEIITLVQNAVFSLTGVTPIARHTSS